jgi:hypothetical protein
MAKRRSLKRAPARIYSKKELEEQEELANEIIDEIIAEEKIFAETVDVGDLVRFYEWVWSRDITGVSSDPKKSEFMLFTGRVQDIRGNDLIIDPGTVRPRVRQTPRYIQSKGSCNFVRRKA